MQTEQDDINTKSIVIASGGLANIAMATGNDDILTVSLIDLGLVDEASLPETLHGEISSVAGAIIFNVGTKASSIAEEIMVTLENTEWHAPLHTSQPQGKEQPEPLEPYLHKEPYFHFYPAPSVGPSKWATWQKVVAIVFVALFLITGIGFFVQLW